MIKLTVQESEEARTFEIPLLASKYVNNVLSDGALDTLCQIVVFKMYKFLEQEADKNNPEAVQLYAQLNDDKMGDNTKKQ